MISKIDEYNLYKEVPRDKLHTKEVLYMCIHVHACTTFTSYMCIHVHVHVHHYQLHVYTCASACLRMVSVYTVLVVVLNNYGINTHTS